MISNKSHVLLTPLVCLAVTAVSAQHNMSRNIYLEHADSVSIEWVRHYASGLIPSEERSRAMAVDASGNVYVTGEAEGGGGIGLYTSTDYLTIKYNSLGEIRWVVRYDGLASEIDKPVAIAVDGSASVYVTGTSRRLVERSYVTDCVTIKYDSTGTQQWLARYYNTYGSAFAIDASGNVYVTGYSRGSSAGSDYVTIKYNAFGIEQWVARYNGPGSYDDYPASLAVDSNGNVYVTGRSHTSILYTSSDYTTVKYSGLGIEQWVARYNGPANSSDAATALTIDASGNIYVTGSSEGSGTASDYATLKYNPSGVQDWVARYNGGYSTSDTPTALAVDETGNVYVTGTSHGYGPFTDYATIKYNALGAQEWVARYNGPANSSDAATALTIDASGNVYVTGWSYDSNTYYDYATVKYTPSGVQQWVSYYHGSGDYDQPVALALDGHGNVYVTGDSDSSGTGHDFATVKYNSSGVEQWVARYDAPHNFSQDEATAATVDLKGNVYIAGRSYTARTTPDIDYVTLKYDPSGVQEWVARYSVTTRSRDIPTAMAVDTEGNVFVTGTSTEIGSTTRAVTIKYNASGTQQWAVLDTVLSPLVAVDVTSSVYVAGSSRYSVGGLSRTGLAVIKYSTTGTRQWSRLFTGIQSFGSPVDIAVDSSGNVFITGTSSDPATNRDYVTISYDPVGLERWVANYDGPVSSYDDPSAIVVDASGNVYVTGSSVGTAWPDYDYATVKYNSAGVQQWVARYGTSSTDGAHALCIDALGNAYVTGTIGSDYGTIKYDSLGIQQWIARYAGPGNGTDYPTDIALDVSANVYVTGWSRISKGTSSSDFATLKYNDSGIEQWTVRYNHPGGSFNIRPIAIGVDSLANVYVKGTTSGGNQSVITTVKYRQLPKQASSAFLSFPLPNRTPYTAEITSVFDHSMKNAYHPDSVVTAFTSEKGLWLYGKSDSINLGYGPLHGFMKADSTPFSVNRHYVGAIYGPKYLEYDGHPGFDYRTKYDSNQSGILEPDETAGIINVLAAAPGRVVKADMADYGTIKINHWSGYVTAYLHLSEFRVSQGDSVSLGQIIGRSGGTGKNGNPNAFPFHLHFEVQLNGIPVDPYGWEGTGKDPYKESTGIANVRLWRDVPVVSVTDDNNLIPKTYQLYQNYPNPFNPSTMIFYSLPRSSHVTLKVFNLLGQEVANLVDEPRTAGQHRIQWNASGHPSGVYFYLLEAGEFIQTMKLLLLR